MNQSRRGDAFHPGDVINNTYRIEALLGRGGTSDVYKVCNEVSGRHMAMKVLKAEFADSDDYLILLKREEEIREVRHDAVVRYSENHRMEDGRVYLMMDFVDGTGLDTKLREGPMPADQLLTICRRVAQGLQAAHSRRIVHRDLSPDNIILRNGDPAQAVIIDFGIAKDTNPGAETIVGNEFAGKYAYAAPEQLRGHTDARTDLYSLGALLLAGFRGEPPDLGNNPMEVVENKTKPLDTTGVPEPLKTVIDRLAAPNPEDRFASAADLLAFLDGPGEAGAEPAPETVIPAAAPASTVSPPSSSPAAATATTAEPAGPGGRGRLIAALGVVLVAGAGIGGYATGALDGLFGPDYPMAAPYTLLVEDTGDAAPSATGHVPSEAVRDDLERRIAAAGGRADLTLASGDIARSWGSDILAAVTMLEPLDTWRLAATGNDISITGETTDQAVEKAVETGFANGLPGGLSASVDIALRDLFLPVGEIEPILQELADCGPLDLTNVPATGFGPDAPITVTGRVAGTATRVQLFDRIRARAGDRQVILDLDVLNPTLCLLESYLPAAPSGGVSIDFYLGDTMEPNPSGTFLVGENPVIDVTLPADVTDGYLTVSILDVSGNVFHLLPNVLRSENSVAALRGGASGAVTVRLAFPLVDGRRDDQIAFRVDASTLGASKVVAILSSEPLFDGLRPMEESAEGYAEALKLHAAENESLIRALDSRILITREP